MDSSMGVGIAAALVVVLSSVWVAVEELRLRARVRQSRDVAVDTKPLLWAGLVLFGWPIFFLLYWIARHGDVTTRLRAA